MNRDGRECEAIRVLRLIVEGQDEQLPAARAEARRLLHAWRVPRTGRLVRTITPEQLRTIAKLRTERKTEHQIAGLVGVPRWTVHYHLRPSQAMQDAMMEAAA